MAGGEDTDPLCPLCDRPIPKGAKASRHHLVPRLRGGTRKGTVLLHQICHSAIHARFTETELARELADIEALRAHPAMAGFLEWVASRPPGFHARTRIRGGGRRKR
ncbi:HNH endonuclease [Arsenicitalea aurantiaca]|uniref:HNH endonuclease n=1 Tax=Arsenicitalea aurantiaca TaxID=1783274 RepID=A0A433X5L2_9HYPH|nr:HNH endonuclease [Arsenicitalea aurantiaca]RUT29376.1 HNH endonuclease [Arsenicitalea aurantiaca]